MYVNIFLLLDWKDTVNVYNSTVNGTFTSAIHESLFKY